MATFINVVPELPKISNEIDGARFEQIVINGRSVRVVRASVIAEGKGWIEKTEQWAKDHRAILFDMDRDGEWSNWTRAGEYALERGYDLVVVREFSVREPGTHIDVQVCEQCNSSPAREGSAYCTMCEEQMNGFRY
jgi:hypothetical protein